MDGRDDSEPFAATRIITGSDVDYGALSHLLVKHLSDQPGFDVHYNRNVVGLDREEGRWRVSVEDVVDGSVATVSAKFVFIGAGGGALPLLLLWEPGVPVGLIVLAFAQIGVHLVFFLHLGSGPDNTNNIPGVYRNDLHRRQPERQYDGHAHGHGALTEPGPMSFARQNAASLGAETTITVQRSAGRISDFVALTKRRVMSLVMFAALVGFAVAPGQRDALTRCIALLCIAAGAGGAGALNMWHEADLDALMGRTAKRPIPCCRVSRNLALAFGLSLAAGGVAILGLMNLAAAALLAFTIFFYVVVYTMWLKPKTPQNIVIVIGGAAGALPPVIGWVAATGHVGNEPMLLFLIIFLWTPPHFWALSLDRAGEYARAGIPMLPVVAGVEKTKRQILVYCAMLTVASLLPWVLDLAGAAYGVAAVLCGAMLLMLAFQLFTSENGSEARAARRLFGFSILYLFILFASLLADASLRDGSLVYGGSI
jgi:protoheme IX farnesyltransferase